MTRKPLFSAASRRCILLLACCVFSGCAAVDSTKQASQSSAAPRNGISYFLPKGKVVVTLTWNATVRSWDASPTVIYEPDTDERFNLDWKDNYCFDDDITVSVDPNTGLLQTLNATSTDQNANTVGNLVGAAANVVHLGPSIAPVSSNGGADLTAEALDALVQRSPASTAPGSVSLPSTAQIVINDDGRTRDAVLLSSPDAIIERGNSREPRLYAAVKATLTRKFDLGPDFPENRKLAIPGNGKAAGIVVRVPIPYELMVDEIISTDPTFRDSSKPRVTCSTAPRIVMLPDSRHDCLLPINRRPLVTDNTKVTLWNGMVQSLEQVRPSMLAAIIGVPKYILTALVPIPVEIRQTQQNISDAQSRIYSDQAAAGTTTGQK